MLTRTGDELYNYLCRTGPLPLDTAQKIFTQLVGSVAYIHTKSCVHRDLKLENVLLDKTDNVKLVDFGFTREYEGKSQYLQTFCGTVCYSAPEMLKGEKYAGEKVDVWSLGIILYALLKGELPFDEDDDMATKAKILKDDPTYPDTFPDAAKNLISKLLSKRPFHRPTLADVLSDPFLVEHAPRQQEILKLSQPAPFTTDLEKHTLERMRSAGVDIDKIIENVLSQRCDSMAGWWALFIEKEQRKQVRREKKRKEKEADMRVLRRLSGASSRLQSLAPPLADVEEEGPRPTSAGRTRSSSRGRTHRRSTPQILVTDLPRLPEGSAIDSPVESMPPPVPKSLRSNSGSRPPVPQKDFHRRKSSTLQIVATNPELLAPMNAITKRRGKRRNNQFLNQLTAIKHWFVDSTKRAKSPGKTSRPQTGQEAPSPKLLTNGVHKDVADHNRAVSGASAATRSSYGATLTPIQSNVPVNGHTIRPNLDMTKTRRHRDSLSPSPITPRSSYRHGSAGLRGRKSTSSSVSSVRSMPRHPSHSKASSRSSNSMDTIHSPGSRSVGRSPHPSIKVLPVTPTAHTFPGNARLAMAPSGNDTTAATSESYNESPLPQPGMNVMFARRKKTPFKGPMLNSTVFSSNIMPGQASPAVRQREGSAGHLSLGLRDTSRRGGNTSGQQRRKSQIIEEEEEEEEDEIEEVEVFPPVHVDIKRGESLQSVTIWDDTGKVEEVPRLGPSLLSRETTLPHGVS